MKASRRMELVRPPIIVLVGELIDRTPGTISLGQGVVAYGPPPEARGRIAACLDDPDTHRYGDVEGLPSLVDALEAKLLLENAIAVRPASRVVVTAGGNMAFMNAVLAVTDPGDEVILQAPYYFNHDMAISIAGCRTVVVPTDEQHQLRPDAIGRAITPRTRAVVTVSPNNPTGAVHRRDALADVNRLCADHGAYHISDEIYEYFTYDDARHFSPGSLPGSGAHTISLFSFSKSYGLAGWRVGYMVVPDALAPAVIKIQDTNLVCPALVAQHAALGALEAGPQYCRGRIRELGTIRTMVWEELARAADLCTVPRAEGAFYFLVRVHTGLSPMRLTERLIAEHRVAVIPGSAFGLNTGCHVRVAYGALDRDTLAEGIARLIRGMRAIAATA